MSTNSELMRKLMEASAHTGPLDHPDVSYSSESKKGEITKVIANLQSYQSGKYTRLGRNLKRIEWLSDKVAALKEQVKGETKEMIADLFHAEDACRTRVVETVSFTFELTKDPKATETVQYAKVLKELEEHLTPELVQVMKSLKAKYSSTTQKSAALKATDKRESVELDEGFLDGLRAFFAKFLQKITAWGIKYDDKLNSLKAQVHVHEQVMGASSASGDLEEAENPQSYYGKPINVLFNWIYAHSDDELAEMGFEVVGGSGGRVGVRHLESGEMFTIAVTSQGNKAKESIGEASGDTGTVGHIIYAAYRAIEHEPDFHVITHPRGAQQEGIMAIEDTTTGERFMLEVREARSRSR